MMSQDFLYALVSARGLPEIVEHIPGAFVHREVVKHTAQFRGMLDQVADLSSEDQSSFIKSLALYEQTVGGLGSATLLDPALRMVHDPDHVLFDWVLNNTGSYEYFAKGVRSFSELQQIERTRSTRAEQNKQLEEQRVAEAKIRRTEKASGNLIIAIKRGRY